MVLRTINSLYDNDNDLMLGLKNQEDAAYKVLYRDFYSNAEKHVINNSGTKDEAKDVFQECVITLTEKVFGNLTLTSSLSTFFYSLVKNNWANKLRSKKRVVVLSDTYESAYEEDNYITESPITTAIRIAFQELGEKCQQILSLYYWEKRSMKEISQRLQYTNAENVKNQKHKCIEQLRRKINK